MKREELTKTFMMISIETTKGVPEHRGPAFTLFGCFRPKNCLLFRKHDFIGFPHGPEMSRM